MRRGLHGAGQVGDEDLVGARFGGGVEHSLHLVGGQLAAQVAVEGVVADADVDRAFRIILQLIVGSVVVPFLDIPAIGVEACGVEKVFPHQSIAGHSRRTRLWRRCPGAEGAEGQHCREYYCFHCSGGEIRISLLRL